MITTKRILLVWPEDANNGLNEWTTGCIVDLKDYAVVNLQSLKVWEMLKEATHPKPLTQEEEKELAALRMIQSDPQRVMLQHEYDRLNLLSGKEWSNASKEIEKLKSEIDYWKKGQKVDLIGNQRKEIEELNIKLAACGVAAHANTPESAKQQRIGQDSPYWSASYGSVCGAVDREMMWRQKVKDYNDELVKTNSELVRVKTQLLKLEEWVAELSKGVEERNVKVKKFRQLLLNAVEAIKSTGLNWRNLTRLIEDINHELYVAGTEPAIPAPTEEKELKRGDLTC